MRVKNNDDNFKQRLLDFGNGAYSIKTETNVELIKIPNEFISKGNIVTDVLVTI